MLLSAWSACRRDRPGRVCSNCQVDMFINWSLTHGVNMGIYIKEAYLDLRHSCGRDCTGACQQTFLCLIGVPCNILPCYVLRGKGTVFPPRVLTVRESNQKSHLVTKSMIETHLVPRLARWPALAQCARNPVQVTTLTIGRGADTTPKSSRINLSMTWEVSDSWFGNSAGSSSH